MLYVHALWDRVQYLFTAKQDYPGTIRAAEAFLKVVPDGPDAENMKKMLASGSAPARRSGNASVTRPPMAPRVTVTLADGVADVRLDRPDKLNGLDLPMFDALVATGRRLSEERSLRAVVLSGNGRAFCAGLDFASFVQADRTLSGAELLDCTPGGLTTRAQEAAWVWHELPVPVIAALHGAVFGGGL